MLKIKLANFRNLYKIFCRNYFTKTLYNDKLLTFASRGADGLEKNFATAVRASRYPAIIISRYFQSKVIHKKIVKNTLL